MRDFTFKETDRPTLPEFNRRFSEIGSVLNGLGNEYVWEKFGTIPAYYALENAGKVTIQQTKTETTHYIGDSVVVDSAGKVSIVNEQSVSITWTNRNDLLGKYLRSNAGYLDASAVYYVPENAGIHDEFGYPNIMYTSDISKVVGYAESLGALGYVNSSDPNAYPIDDGYTYTPLGMLGEKTRIETGSYVGTGTNGVNNKTSLAFNFNPKLVVVSYNGLVTTFVNGDVNAKYGNKDGDSSMSLIASWSGNTVNWYSTYTSYPSTAAMYQLNGSGNYYYYTAIG